MSIPVRYDDIDTMGHVNNKAYIGFLEEARIDYYLKVLDLDRRNLRFETVVRRLDIQYDAPVFFADVVRVYVRCTRIGHRSMEFEQVVTRRAPADEAEAVAARAVTTLVAFDLSAGRSRPVAQNVSRAIEEYEKTPPERGSSPSAHRRMEEQDDER